MRAHKRIGWVDLFALALIWAASMVFIGVVAKAAWLLGQLGWRLI
jgi:hypothetical protein